MFSMQEYKSFCSGFSIWVKYNPEYYVLSERAFRVEWSAIESENFARIVSSACQVMQNLVIVITKSCIGGSKSWRNT